MSAWKIPLFALTLVTFIGTAAYAEDIPPPGYPPAQGEGTTLQTPSMSAQDILAPAPAAPEAAPAAMPAPNAAPAPEAAPAAAPAVAPAPEKKAEATPPKKVVHKNIKDMTPEERAGLQQELETWFKSLPLEKQAAIKTQSTAKKLKPKKAAAPALAPAAAPAPAVETAPATAPAPGIGQMPMPMPAPMPDMEQMPMPMPTPAPAPAPTPAPGQ